MPAVLGGSSIIKNIFDQNEALIFWNVLSRNVYNKVITVRTENQEDKFEFGRTWKQE